MTNTPHTPADDDDKIIGFHVGGQAFGLPIAAVKETVTARALTRVPFCPPAIAGLINLRGDIVAILDLSAILGLPGSATLDPGRRRFLLLRGEHGALCGLLIDELAVTLRLPGGALRPCPRTLPESLSAYLQGVVRVAEDDQAPRLLLLLDPERLVKAEPLLTFRRTRD